MKRSKKQGLSGKQKSDLKSLNKLDSQDRATVNYKIRTKLEGELDGLKDIEFMLSHLPRDHAKKAVNDKHIAKAMNILLALLDLREFKRVRQNAPGEEGYIIKRYKRTPLTQKDYNRYSAMRWFFINYRKYFNPRVVLPEDTNILDISPTHSLTDWAGLDDQIDYKIHLQQLYGDSQKPFYKMNGPEGRRIKEIEMTLSDPKTDQETRMKLMSQHLYLSAQVIKASLKDANLPSAKSDDELEKLTHEAIQKNIDATNEWIEFFKSTH